MYGTVVPSHPGRAELAGPARGLGGLAIAVGLLAFAPVAVLAPAIGWPASLGRPAAEQLAAIAAAPGAVTLGYGLYLLYSLLVAPLVIGLAARGAGGLARPWAATAAAFAALSSLARAIGILRWLTVMPALAASHGRGDAAQRQQIELLFDALTRYGGGIGEVLGVSLLMALALGALAVTLWRDGSLPRPLIWAGGAVALLLLGLSAPTFGVAFAPPTALAVSALSLWLLVVGGWSLRPARRPAAGGGLAHNAAP